MNQTDKLLEAKNVEVFKPYRNVLSKLCLMGIYIQDLKKVEDYLEEKKTEISKNEKIIEHKKEFLEKMDLHDFIKEDIEYFENDQLKVFYQNEKRMEKDLR